MNSALILFFRLVCWLLLLTLESVIGFPWISIYLAGEWIFGFSEKTALPSLLIMTVLLASLYSLPLTGVALILLAVRQSVLFFRKNSWQRWAVFWTAALAVGILHRLPLTVLTLLSTAGSFLFFFKVSGGRVIRQVWQTVKLPRSSER